MRQIGFSTGALARGDFEKALAMLAGHGTKVVELSALRATELDALVGAVDTLRVDEQFDYVSFHAPSKVDLSDEQRVVDALVPVARRGWPIVVHPQALHTPSRWREFGNLLCIENMDSRSDSGRTFEEMEQLFGQYPGASFCLDLGHARQIDPSMVEAYRMLTGLRDRLRQIHLSEVTSTCQHARISFVAKRSFQSVAELVPRDVPIVLESIVGEAEVQSEIATALEALTPLQPRVAAAAE